MPRVALPSDVRSHVPSSTGWATTQLPNALKTLPPVQSLLQPVACAGFLIFVDLGLDLYPMTA
jgi:hypothetical protein